MTDRLPRLLLALLVAGTARAAAPAIISPTRLPSLPPRVSFDFGEARHNLPYEIMDGWVVVGGDMLVGREDELSTGTESWARNDGGESLHLAASTIRFWPGGTIPYVLTADYLSVHSREKWDAAVDHLHRRTRLRLVERTTQSAWVEVTSTANDGCNAVLGNRGGGGQSINLAAGCGSRGTHVHEILHALGRPHEHQRHDRDTFIEVLRPNIRLEHQKHFDKMSHHRYMPPSSRYDYESVMHYQPYASSRNGKPTMRVRTPPAPRSQPLGRTNSLTPLDVTVVDFLVALSLQESPGRYWEETPFGPRYPLDGPFGIY